MKKFILGLVLLLAACSPVAVAVNPNNPNESISLYSTQGSCPENTKEAVYKDTGVKIKGCYADAGPFYVFQFEDGDRLILPKSLFK